MASTTKKEFAAGDRVADACRVAGDGRLRMGEVVELVERGGQFHGYRIRWDDGTVSLWSPSARGLQRAGD
jgi:Domain of unknown function (DUF1918)